jgi:hypothetical protein
LGGCVWYKREKKKKTANQLTAWGIGIASASGLREDRGQGESLVAAPPPFFSNSDENIGGRLGGNEYE